MFECSTHVVLPGLSLYVPKKGAATIERKLISVTLIAGYG